MPSPWKTSLPLGILRRERDLVSEELTELNVRQKVKSLLLKVDEEMQSLDGSEWTSIR